MIPMDSYTSNSTEMPYITWIYQKYFQSKTLLPLSRVDILTCERSSLKSIAVAVGRIGWGLYPSQAWPEGESQGALGAASDEVVASRMDRLRLR